MTLAVLSNTSFAQQPHIYINAGGPEVIDLAGNTWIADTYYNTGGKYETALPIANAFEERLYQTERYALATGEELKYEIPVLNGNYNISLHFAEIYRKSQKKGGRVFSVSIEDTIVFEGLDIFDTVGAETALIMNASTTVTDGYLTIELIHLTNNPKISAIEVHESIASTPTQTIQTASSPTRTPTMQRTKLPSATATDMPSQVPSTPLPSNEPSRQPSNISYSVLTSEPVSSFTPIYINAGGGDYTDSSGNTWAADDFYNTGSTYNSSASIVGTTDDSLYQSERWDKPGGDELKYDIVVPDGSYLVILHFSENYKKVQKKSGLLFDVSMEGTVVFDNVDIYHEAGAYTVLTKNATVDVTDGLLTIKFIHGVENPKLNAIEIHSAGTLTAPTSAGTSQPTSVPPMAPSRAPSMRPSDSVKLTAAPATLSMRPSDVPSSQPSEGPTNAPKLTAFEPIRINAGGPEYIDSNSNTWVADVFYNTGNTYKTKSSQTISGTTDVSLYKSERWDKPGGYELKYDIPVPDGSYLVILHFSENYKKVQKKGGRLFDVSVEGTIVFDNLDIYDEAGAFTVLTKNATVDVTDGLLTIEFIHGVENPKLCAIEIRSAAALPVPTSAGTSQTTSVPSRTPSLAPSMPPSEAVKLTAPPATSSMRPSDVSSSQPPEGPTNPPKPTAFEPIRINAGGPEYIDSNSNTWIADDFYNTGKTYKTKSSQAISGTTNDDLYKTERYHNAADPVELKYEIPVRDGTFLVTLHFADIYQGTHEIGARVFDVLIEGFGVLKDLDIYSEVGPYTKLAKIVPASVSDGMLTIEFVPVVDSPKISAIEIKALGSVTVHQAHAVPGGPYFMTDTDDDNFASILVDGSFSHTHGTGASLFAWKWIVNGTQVGSGEVTTLTLPVGQHNLTLEVFDTDGDVATDVTTVTIRPFGFPDCTSLTPDNGDFQGGKRTVITGSGFTFAAENTTVHFGLVKFTGPSEISIIDENTVEVTAAPPRAPDTVQILVETPIGVSTGITYTYINYSLPPVMFTKGTIIPYVYGSTSIAFGPDGKLYIGTQAGNIIKITLDDDNQVIRSVTSTAIQDSDPSFRSILGIAFDPMDTSSNPTVYAAHSTLFHGQLVSNNGKVSAVSGENLETVEHVVTGLPVSDHDHGINGMEFGDHGELYIQIGGNTNAGVPGALSGSGLQEEGHFSAATIVAHLARPNYDGKVEYDANGNQVSGFDVEVFASGQRNSYDIVLHSSGNLLATDNGPNFSFGKKSVDCNTDGWYASESDKLNLLVKGGFYGHPNRKRGETNPHECKWRSINDVSDDEYTAPIKSLPSSSDGIVEFQTDHFGGQLRGHLIVGRYKGALYDITLTSDGKSVLNNVEMLESDGGLDVTQGPDGSLFVLQNDKGKVIYYKPSELPWTALQVKSVFPRRGPESGGSLLTLYGQSFGTFGTPTVTVGGQDCPLTAPASATKLTCILPSGTGTADVLATAGNETTTFSGSYRYISGRTGTMP
jgi:glucose/arabinose dehydrogenase/predicted nucleic acid-binding protein